LVAPWLRVAPELHLLTREGRANPREPTPVQWRSFPKAKLRSNRSHGASPPLVFGEGRLGSFWEGCLPGARIVYRLVLRPRRSVGSPIFGRSKAACFLCVARLSLLGRWHFFTGKLYNEV
jgi:hypothetical protein